MALKAHIPPPLQPGGTVALAATARAVSSELIETTAQGLQQRGYNVLLANNLDKQFGIFAGTDYERATALQTLLDSPDIQAIIFMRGGYGTTRILNLLDYEELLRYPKWIIGFSDTTVLINYLAKIGIATIHGPMGLHYADPAFQLCWEASFALMNHQFEQYNQLMYLCANENLQVLVNKEYSGKAVVGNLSLLAHTIGTTYMPDYQDSILFIEDVDEYLYHIDRMLWQLSHSGVFEKLAGVCIGHFTSLKDNPEPFLPTFPALIHEHATRHNLPVIDLPVFGHQPPNMPLMIGSTYRLSSKGIELISDTM